MSRAGFTLIELLIVVAIIAILAAIAVPNFLEAQTRAKVSRAKADIRSVGVALESYAIDHNAYPWHPNVVNDPLRGFTPVTLTTPLAYISSLPPDAFGPGVRNTLLNIATETFPNPFDLMNYETRAQHQSYRPGNWELDGPGDRVRWIVVSVGPDRFALINEGFNFHGNAPEYFSGRPGVPGLGGGQGALGANGWYDPTNGTTSHGDVIGYGPGGPSFEYPGPLGGSQPTTQPSS